MFKARAWWSLAGALSLWLLAQAEEPQPSTAADRAAQANSRVDPGIALRRHAAHGEPVSTASMPRAVRRAVVADAASDSRWPKRRVVLASAEQVTWGDGSSGLPAARLQLTRQMLVPGFASLRARTAGRMRHHADTAWSNVVTCGSPVPRRTIVRLSSRAPAPVDSAPERRAGCHRARRPRMKKRPPRFPAGASLVNRLSDLQRGSRDASVVARGAARVGGQPKNVKSLLLIRSTSGVRIGAREQAPLLHGEIRLLFPDQHIARHRAVNSSPYGVALNGPRCDASPPKYQLYEK